MNETKKHTKMAKDLRSGDRIVSGGQVYEVKRCSMNRKDWNHATIYFRVGRATTVARTTEFQLA